MTQPTVDADMYRALGNLRRHFGEVEVLAVRPSPPLLPAPVVQVLLLEEELDGPAPASTCSCHASDLYAGLWRCPSCGHRSFDAYTWARRPGEPLEGSCERRRCGYEGTYKTGSAVGNCGGVSAAGPSPSRREQ
jgi:hypothetical protein